ncbi:MAG TPA: antibiotic biosynthesis monooxygenase [Acidimicrobiia bacterium]|nr:antibiotic biosynthesis monooxygenase [Acidimicrobiia bacterium]
MIVRIWRGWTRPEDCEAYAQYIKETGLADYSATPGCQGAHLVSRRDGDLTEFLAISFWDSVEAVQAFAGDEIGTAVFYPEDDRFLVERETVARHYTVHL